MNQEGDLLFKGGRVMWSVCGLQGDIRMHGERERGYGRDAFTEIGNACSFGSDRVGGVWE